MTSTKQTKTCLAATLPMWRRTFASVSTVVASAKTVRADVAAIHGKGRTPTPEVDQ